MNLVAIARSRLDSPEGPLIERKPEKSEKDWRRTLVAFANSTNDSDLAILYIGAADHGEHPGISGIKQVDEIQRTIAAIAADQCYPPIVVEFAPFTINQNNGEIHILAVLIPPSVNRPHFGGIAHVRVGSKSVPASASVFKELIASNNSTARKLLAWKDKRIDAKIFSPNNFHLIAAGQITACTATSVQFQEEIAPWNHVIPLSDVEFGDRENLAPILFIAYWKTERELIELMVSRYLFLAATSEIFALGQGSYLYQQFSMYADLVGPVLKRMMKRDKNPDLLHLFSKISRGED